MPAGRPAYSNSSTVKWAVVDHPDGRLFALYCALIKQYYMDTDAKEVRRFGSKREATMFMNSREFRGL